MNRGQLTVRVARVLGVTRGTSDDELEDAELLDELANEAVLDVIKRTRIHVRHGQTTLDEGANEYEIDPSILRIFDLKRNDTTLIEQARDEVGVNGYSIPGYARIFFGAPASAGDVLSFWYTPAPTPMTEDSHDPADELYGRIPVEYHRALLDYMCWRMADKLGDMQAGRGERYRILYEGQDGMAGAGSDLGRIKLAINTRGGLMNTRRARETLVSTRDPSYWQG